MTKQFDTVPVEDYYVVVDKEADVLYDEWCLEAHKEYETDLARYRDPTNPEISWFLRQLNMDYRKEKPKGFSLWKKQDGSVWKIIATIGKRIEGIPLIEIPDEIEQEAKSKYCYISQNPPYTTITPKAKIEGYIEGYKAAQSKGTYTEEDIIGFALWSSDSSWVRRPDARWVNLVMDEKEQQIATDTELIKLYQSLQKKKVIKVVVLEMEPQGREMSVVEYINPLVNPETNTIIPKEVIYE